MAKIYLFRSVVLKVGGVNITELTKDGKIEITPMTEKIFESQQTADSFPRYRGVLDTRMTCKMKFAQLADSLRAVRQMQFEQVYNATHGQTQKNYSFSLYCPAEDTEILSSEIIFTTLNGVMFGEEFSERDVEFELPDGLTMSKFQGIFFDPNRSNPTAVPLG